MKYDCDVGRTRNSYFLHTDNALLGTNRKPTWNDTLEMYRTTISRMATNRLHVMVSVNKVKTIITTYEESGRKLSIIILLY